MDHQIVPPESLYLEICAAERTGYGFEPEKPVRLEFNNLRGPVVLDEINAIKMLENFALFAQSKLHLRGPLGTTSLLLVYEGPELFEIMLSNTGSDVIEVHRRKNSH